MTARGLLLAGVALFAAGCPAEPPRPAAPATEDRSESAPPAGPLGAPEVLATLDGEPIRLDEISSRARLEIYRRQVDVHGLLDAEIDRILQDRLLERAAKARGVDAEALLAAEVDAKAPAPTAEQIDAELAAQGAPASSRPRVELYLRERARQARRLEFLASLERAAEVERHLEAPTPPRLALSLEDAPVRGPEDAAVTLVAFLDYRAPTSRACAQDVARLAREFPQQVSVAHRAVLRAGDELGLAAALLAERARREGAFWTIRDALLLRDDDWTQRDLHALGAEHLGLSPAEIEGARHDPTALMEARRLARHVIDAGVTAPPVVFVEGTRVSCTFGYERLRAEVQAKLP